MLKFDFGDTTWQLSCAGHHSPASPSDWDQPQYYFPTYEVHTTIIFFFFGGGGLLKTFLF